jgi:ribulose 1,5-bisphosphate synthetase/thiazole synthase
LGRKPADGIAAGQCHDPSLLDIMISSQNDRRFDVIVCGGGSGGCAAAYGAARAGARTLLLERLGFCGGTPVAAGIHTLDAVDSCVQPEVRVVGGFAADLIAELTAMNGLATRDNPEEAFTIHPEFMKVALDRLLASAGVETLYHALVVDSLCNAGVVQGVEAALLDGRANLHANVVVDGTGDAMVAVLSGAEWRMDAALQAITYHFRLGNVKPGATWRELENACRDAMRAGAPEGMLYGGPWVIRLADTEMSVNATRVLANPVDPVQRSQAERNAREDMLRIAEILRAQGPHLARSYIISGATDLHIRESRKIVGDYIFTEQDLLARRRFPDAIALGAWPVDIHPGNGFVGVHPHKENPPEPYEIPYRCLLPRNLDGLLVVGKPISTTHRAHGSTRVPGTSMATGHAAGVAAALASQPGVTPRRISMEVLQSELMRQSALLSLSQLAAM